MAREGNFPRSVYTQGLDFIRVKKKRRIRRLFSFLLLDILCLYAYWLVFLLLADENHVIRETANTNIEKNEMTYESTTNNNSTMMWINDQPAPPSPLLLSSPSYFNERTTSSSSSEQLIPKEKQTGRQREKEQYCSSFKSSFFSRNVFTCLWQFSGDTFSREI